MHQTFVDKAIQNFLRRSDSFRWIWWCHKLHIFLEWSWIWYVPNEILRSLHLNNSEHPHLPWPHHLFRIIMKLLLFGYYLFGKLGPLYIREALTILYILGIQMIGAFEMFTLRLLWIRGTYGTTLCSQTKQKRAWAYFKDLLLLDCIICCILEWFNLVLLILMGAIEKLFDNRAEVPLDLLSLWLSRLWPPFFSLKLVYSWVVRAYQLPLDWCLFDST